MITELLSEDQKENMSEESNNHIPVMLNEVMALLDPKENDVMVDCTMGLGGHSEAILKKVGPCGRLIGIDRDEQALRLVRERLKSYREQAHFIQGDFRNLDSILGELKIAKVNGILLDLGISSFQLDDAQRGFSFQADGPLDMRMDQNNPVSAFDLVNSMSENELSLILRNYGEERWHNRIARQIIRQRGVHPIATTRDLKEIVLKAVPHKPYGGERIHPATRTFQAIRIAVNGELESLEMALDKYFDFLAPGGRIAVIAFHSLEDRIVKNKFRAFAKEGKIRLMVKKPLRPSDEECRENSRSRSAKLRAAERITDTKDLGQKGFS